MNARCICILRGLQYAEEDHMNLHPQPSIMLFMHLETTLTNYNCIQDKLKSRINLENACYYNADQNFLSGPSKNVKIKCDFLCISVILFIL